MCSRFGYINSIGSWGRMSEKMKWTKCQFENRCRYIWLPWGWKFEYFGRFVTLQDPSSEMVANVKFGFLRILRAMLKSPDQWLELQFDGQIFLNWIIIWLFLFVRYLYSWLQKLELCLIEIKKQSSGEGSDILTERIESEKRTWRKFRCAPGRALFGI